MVGDGQQMAIPAIAELELAFEVGAPQFVGRGARGERSAARAVARHARGDQSERPAHAPESGDKSQRGALYILSIEHAARLKGTRRDTIESRNHRPPSGTLGPNHRGCARTWHRSGSDP